MFQKENVTAPKSTYIKAGDSQFEIVPEVLGNTVKKKPHQVNWRRPFHWNHKN